MRNWRIPLSTFNRLPLAADVRMGPVSYVNDHIWDLSTGGEPGGLNLATTFGLRARSFRMFPRFLEHEAETSDPARFDEAPVIHRVYPNYVLLSYAPLPGIEVTAEYWVTSSQSMRGRMRVHNTGVTERKIRLEWIALISPTGEGQRMAPQQVQQATALAGQSQNLFPVVIASGETKHTSSPLPAIISQISLLPGISIPFTWAFACLDNWEASYAEAAKLLSKDWEAERAALDMVNASLVEIETGNPDWDSLLMLSQVTALRLISGPGNGLPHPSLLTTRHSGQGVSLRGDGSDYGFAWNGQSPLEVAQLADILLPAAPELVTGMLRNFLHSANPESGEIDLRPGMAGQRTRRNATPILAYLCLQAYRINGDKAFLQEAFPLLFAFVQAWLGPTHDRDGDGYPEWDSPSQLGFIDHPIFSNWHAWSLGVDLATLESPGLGSMLYMECQSLLSICDELGLTHPRAAILAWIEHLHSAVESSWAEDTAAYSYFDRDGHEQHSTQLLLISQGNGSYPLEQTFELPARLVIRLVGHTEQTCKPAVHLHGLDSDNQPVSLELPASAWNWHAAYASITTPTRFRHLRSVTFDQACEKDTFSLITMPTHFSDITTLLPLWAGIPGLTRSVDLLEKTIFQPQRFWRPHGLPFIPQFPLDQGSGSSHGVHLIWNMLVGRGLLRYDQRVRAAQLLIRLMTSITANFKQRGAFSQQMHARTGLPDGDENALEGLPPLSFFLEVAGVRVISPWTVELSGFNPMPWPISVRYRGLTVRRYQDRSEVEFPDGHGIAIGDPAPCRVTARQSVIQVEPQQTARRIRVSLPKPFSRWRKK